MLTASIIRATFYETTRRNIAEDSHLYTRRRENLNSHLYSLGFTRYEDTSWQVAVPE
jgi:phage terminase large subunit-like protein